MLSLSGLANVTLALSLAVATSACGGFGKTPEERALARADALLDDVEASDAQRSSVRAAVVELTSSFAEARGVRSAAKDAVLGQLQAAKVDGALVSAEADKVTAAFTKSAHAFVDQGALIHATLSPAQRQVLTDKLKPGRGMKAAFFVAGRMGYGPPADAKEGRERAAARLEKGLDAIEASEAQRQALRPLAAGLVEQALPLLDERDLILEAFTNAWKSERADVASLHALVDTEAAQVNEVAHGAAEAFVQAHAILTPAQRQQLGARMAAEGSHGCDG